MQFDHVPHTHASEDIVLTATSDGTRYAELRKYGRLALNTADAMDAAAAFASQARQVARANERQFGTQYTTQDILTATVLLAEYYIAAAREDQSAPSA